MSTYAWTDHGRRCEARKTEGGPRLFINGKPSNGASAAVLSELLSLAERWAEGEERVESVERALKLYVRHLPGCGYYKTDGDEPAAGNLPCDCGLAAVLGQLLGEAERRRELPPGPK